MSDPDRRIIRALGLLVAAKRRRHNGDTSAPRCEEQARELLAAVVCDQMDGMPVGDVVRTLAAGCAP